MLHRVSVGKTDGGHGLVLRVLDVEVGGLAHVVHDAGPGNSGPRTQVLLQILDVGWPDEVVEPVICLLTT